MGRYRPSGSYGHAIQHIGGDDYRLHWTIDRYYPGSRQRHPRGQSRDADATGAARFAKRWGIEMPDPACRAALSAGEGSDA